MSQRRQKNGLSRRQVLGTTAAAAAGAAGVAGGVVPEGCRRDHAGRGADRVRRRRRRGPRRSPQQVRGQAGELDEYYVFFSSGQTGEVRIVGLPSMRELMRIPVFNRDSATGWGQTNESLKILTEGLTPREPRVPEGHAAASTRTATCTIPHPSFTDGTYDGRYLFVNDKSNTRVARIRLDVMKCDKIIQLPNQPPCTACACRNTRRPATCSATARTGCRSRTTARSSTIRSSTARSSRRSTATP